MDTAPAHKPMVIIGHNAEIAVNRASSSRFRIRDEYIQFTDYTIRVIGERKIQLEEVSRYFGLQGEDLLNALLDEGITSLFGLAKYDQHGPREAYND